MASATSLDIARQVADTVLHEGYVLYPYRASATKNQLRWQWGVLAPKAWTDAEGSERWWARTEFLVELDPAASSEGSAAVQITVRFMSVVSRTVEDDAGRPVERLVADDGRTWTPWDEGIDQEVTVPAVPVVQDGGGETAVDLGAGTDIEEVAGGRLVRRRWPVEAVVRVETEPFDGPWRLARVGVTVENTGAGDPTWSRDEALRRSLVATHVMASVGGGRFLSMADPPEFARPWADACRNEGLWPVVVGDEGEEILLSAPIILPDHPEVAPESPTELCDATEIDEILALRVMTLTEDEKREARGTDPRAAAIIDACDGLPPEIMARLHGVVRSLPGTDIGAEPLEETVTVASGTIRKGSAVRLRPGRRADAQDLFLAGRTATVAKVVRDFDDAMHVAVTLDDDPAADFHEWYGRFLYFHPEEVEVVEP